MDYLIPTAMEVPEFAIGHCETPSPCTPHGIKGGGEGGRMMAPAAINAADRRRARAARRARDGAARDAGPHRRLDRGRGRRMT